MQKNTNGNDGSQNLSIADAIILLEDVAFTILFLYHFGKNKGFVYCSLRVYIKLIRSDAKLLNIF